jgi:hypothetical protein
MIEARPGYLQIHKVTIDNAIMRERSTLRLAVAEIAAVAINVAGLGLWFYEDYSADATMLLYAVGASAAILYAILAVALATPASALDGSPQHKRKWKVITDFSMIAFFTIGVLWVFVGVFLFLILRSPVEFNSGTLGVALAIVLSFQFADFVVDVLALRPLTIVEAETYIYKKGMGQTVVLYFGVFIGVAVAFVLGNGWFAVPLFIFKIIIDIAQPIQFFLGKEDNLNASILRSELKLETRS